MPIYEYQCEKCGGNFEALVRGGESPECPSCGAKELKKLLSAPAAPHAGAQPDACPAKNACDLSSCCGGGCNLRAWE